MTIGDDFNIESIFASNLLGGFEAKLPEPLNSRKAAFTLYARNGLYHVAKQIIGKRPKRNQALVPSYSCGDELEAILRAGFDIVPYEVNSNLDAELDSLKSKIVNKIGLVLITHYFGLPQKNILLIKEICANSDIFLIEDCAHVFGGVFNGKPLGTFGDASIFSLRKFVSIPHGGVVVLNNYNLNLPNFIPPSNKAVLTDLFIYLGQKNGFFPRGIPINQIYKQIGLSCKNQHCPRLEKFGGYNLALSNFAKFLIKKTNPKKIICTRINNYNFYQNIFSTHATRRVKPLLPHLPPGVVPLLFPVVVENSEEFCLNLRQKGYNFCQPFWSYLHKYVNWREYPRSRKLKKSLVSLPLDVKIDEKLMINFLKILDKI